MEAYGLEPCRSPPARSLHEARILPRNIPRRKTFALSEPTMIRLPSHARSLIRPRTLAVSLLGICCTGLLAACGSSGSSQVASASVQARSDLVSILQDDAMLQNNPAGMLADARALGVDVVRVSVFWSQIAPSPTSARRPHFDAATRPPTPPPAGRRRRDRPRRRGRGIGWTSPSPAGRRCGRRAGRPRPRNARRAAAWKPSASEFGPSCTRSACATAATTTRRARASRSPRVDSGRSGTSPTTASTSRPRRSTTRRVEVAPRLYRGLLDASWSALAATGTRRAATRS